MHMKKILALVLAVVTLFSFTTVAFAADEVTIPATASPILYDTNYFGSGKVTKWYSIQAASKYFLVNESGQTGDAITISVYDADGKQLKVDTKGGGSNGSFWSMGECYMVTVGKTYYVKADFDGAYFSISNCWLDFGKYNNYGDTKAADFKLVSTGVAKTFSGSDIASWDVYEISDEYVWMEEYLDENLGCYFASAKMVANVPVFFENNCSTPNIPSIYKGLYMEEGFVGSELAKGEQSYYVVSYDVINSAERVMGTTSRGSMLVYVPAGSTITESNNIVHIKGVRTFSLLDFLKQLFADAIVYFHGFLPLIWNHIVAIINLIMSLFA